LIIVNPAAGRLRGLRRRLDRVVAALRRRGCAVTLRHAGAPGDAERLAREAEAEFDVIVAAGGDGTLNAVLNGIAGNVAALSRPLALLPFGTANVLAHEIAMPRDPEGLAAVLAAAPARPVWPGRIGERLFLAMASSGFDAAVVAAVNPRLKRHFGRFAVVWAILACLARYRPCELSVRIGDIEHRAAAAIAAKGRCYAGRYVVAPEASLAAPSLDLVLFERDGRLAALRYLWVLLRGRLAARPDVRIVRCRGALISAAQALPVEADGDIVGRLPIAVGVGPLPVLLVQPGPAAANRRG